MLTESEARKRRVLNAQAFSRLSPEDKKEFVNWTKNMHAQIGHGAGSDTCSEIGWAVIRLAANMTGEGVDDEQIADVGRGVVVERGG